MENELIYDFGVRLRQLREDRGFSQAAFAKRLGVSKETVYRYENNIQSPSLERTKQMAVLLRTSIDYLVGLDDKYTVKFPTLTPEQHKALIAFVQAFAGAQGEW